MPPVRSRSTHFRTLRKIRKENEIMIRRIEKIKQSQGHTGVHAICPSQAAETSQSTECPPSIDKEETLQVIFSMVTKHGLTKACIPDLLELVRTLMSPGSGDIEHLKSAYRLQKAMEEDRKTHTDIADDVIFHHYCAKCEKLFEGSEENCKFCGHPRFDADGKPHAVFMEMNPRTQIQDFFRDKSFVDGIAYRFKRQHAEGEICDVYDGELYQSLFKEEGFLSDPNNLSLIWHTDGVSIFKSSSMQAWPVQSTICELPPNKRFSKDYVLIHGLWFGKHKPTMSTFLQPIIETMNDLCSNGIKVHPYGSNDTICTKVCSLACTMDLPAAASVKELHQWNGMCGCTMCEEPGQAVATGIHGGSCRAYLYPHSEPMYRTDERLLSQVGENLETGKVTKGVKGFSSLFQLDGFRVSDSVLIDYLHGVCLGVMKRMLNCWFDRRGEDFYIGDSKTIINERLGAIRTPNTVHRPPRSVDDKVHYKASEYRNWLLYYGLHITKDILPSDYYVHFAMLVRAIHILLSRRITPVELEEARILLKKWYFLVETYYGADQCTINVHNTGLHLVRCVELCGPLWAFSCFFFESVCGHLAKLVNGTQQIPKQILSGIRIRQYLKRTRKTSQNVSVNRILKKDKRQLIKLSDGFSRVGKCRRWKRELHELDAVKRMDRTLGTARGIWFNRVERRGEVYTTEKELQHKANHYVVYKHANGLKCGIIHRFITLNGLTREIHIALVRPTTVEWSHLMNNIPGQLFEECNLSPQNLVANFMHGVQPRSCPPHLEALPLCDIVEPFIFLPTQRNEGECVFMPTVFEHD